MRKFLIGACVVVAAAVAVAAAGPTCEPQDTWTGVERIVAVGDVHGDYGQFVKVLRAAEVVDEKNNWIGGKTHLVQTGDILDRGPDSRKAMDLVMRLERQAAEAGGAVHALIGNHEAMVLLGDWRYVVAEEEKAFGGAEAYREAMSARGKYGKWIRGHQTAIKINDLLFVHAGITPSVARLSLGEINRTVREELRKGETEGLAGSASGPVWDRSMILGEADEARGGLDAVLKRYGARRMVVGHTVTPDGVLAMAGGRLILIDVGMAALYGGPAACLVVEKGVLWEVRHPKVKRRVRLEERVREPAGVLESAAGTGPRGDGAPARTRTWSLRLRRPLLCPLELQARPIGPASAGKCTGRRPPVSRAVRPKSLCG